MLAAKVRRKPGNGVRRLREAGRCLKRPRESTIPPGGRSADPHRRGGRQDASRSIPREFQVVSKRHCWSPASGPTPTGGTAAESAPISPRLIEKARHREKRLGV